MLITWDALTDLLGTFSTLAVLAIAYSSVMRLPLKAWATRMGLGALFGLVAVLQMSDSIHFGPGVLIDLRILPVTLAGAFLGVEGALICTGTALAARLAIGGPAALSGSVSILMSGAAGLIWARLTHRNAQRGPLSLVLLWALTSSNILAAAFMPPEIAWQFATIVWPLLTLFHFVGILLVGSLLDRERARTRLELELRDAADHDALTGLLNRRGLDRRVRGSTSTIGFGLLLVDLDHFKRVNDKHGHVVGDTILSGVGRILREVTRSRDLVVRLGGEEFAIYLPDTSPDEVQAVAERICEAVRAKRLALDDNEALTVTTSVGGAWTADKFRLRAMLERADAALYTAKRSGRNCCRFDLDNAVVDLAA